MDVLIHLNTNDTDKQSELLGNIKNLREDEKTSQDIIAVVLNANGVDMIKKDSSAEEFVKEYIDNGVKFKACSNSLENREIGEDDLISGVETVGSGIGAVMKLQDRGFNYLKI
jgi:intracellular sulfur oxidation DsrE/DsrF family protein